MIYALHGMLGDARDWQGLGIGVRAVDLWRQLELGADLEAWGRNFNEQVVGEGHDLVGYSMGGRLALHALLDRPRAWRSLVVLSTHPGLSDLRQRELRLKEDRAWAVLARSLPWADFLQKWNAQAVLKSVEPSAGQMDLQDRRERVARAFECWSLGRQEDLRGALAGCCTPVLWITGELDEKFTQLVAEVVSGNHFFEHQVIAGAGHRLLFENKDVLKRLKIVIGDFQKRFM
ncbi:MAG: alpha/beta fold hydrolase [Verrucomicrobiales bacterium]|nr:alpha/beta fold hydrolase [Verrucomicrobiales bacterium]